MASSSMRFTKRTTGGVVGGAGGIGFVFPLVVGIEGGHVEIFKVVLRIDGIPRVRSIRCFVVLAFGAHAKPVDNRSEFVGFDQDGFNIESRAKADVVQHRQIGWAGNRHHELVALVHQWQHLVFARRGLVEVSTRHLFEIEIGEIEVWQSAPGVAGGGCRCRVQPRPMACRIGVLSKVVHGYPLQPKNKILRNPPSETWEIEAPQSSFGNRTMTAICVSH